VAALADIDDATLAEVRGRALTVSEPATVDAAFDRMAGEINARLAGRRPLVLAVMDFRGQFRHLRGVYAVAAD